MEIAIKRKFGESCLTFESGMTLHAQIYQALKAGDVVVLNFAGVRLFGTPFFNAAIGQLLRDFEPDELNQSLEFLSLDEFGRSVIVRVIKNAKRFYDNPEAFSKAFDRVLGDEGAA